MVGFAGPLVRFFAYWFGSLALLTLAIRIWPLAPSNVSTLVIFAGLFSFVIVAFALPSSYVADALSHAHVEAVIARVRLHAPFSSDEIDALLSTVEDFHNRALARISAFQWAMAASWALATYLFAQYTGVALKLMPVAGMLQSVVDAGFQLTLFAVLSLLMLWGIFGYKRGVDKTFTLCRLSLRQLQLRPVSNSLPRELVLHSQVEMASKAEGRTTARR
jgi:hypothetical protein